MDRDKPAEDPSPTFAEFTDPRLVAVYDAVNPVDEYEAFYAELAAELSAALIVDVGCGTGLLTCALARRGHRVVGVDPSPAMLDGVRTARGCAGSGATRGGSARSGRTSRS